MHSSQLQETNLYENWSHQWKTHLATSILITHHESFSLSLLLSLLFHAFLHSPPWMGATKRRRGHPHSFRTVFNPYNTQTYDKGFSYYKGANRIVRTIQWTQASVMKQRNASFRDIIPSGTDSRQ